MKKKKENTVFIIGAGASTPYGFPTSSVLRKDIINNFADKFSSIYSSRDKSEEFSLKVKIEEIKKFQKRFDLSSIYSIDYFIARNPLYLDLGKDAIIIHLLESERNCKFRESSLKSNEDWYSHIFNSMISDYKSPQSFERIAENMFTFITFNYERSLEYFLAESIGNSFEGITEGQLKKVMSSIPIIHVYGKISNLPFNSKEDGLKFGQTIQYSDSSTLRNNIKTINDTVHEITNHISEIITEAERIFFLGFGYDRINLNNIGIPSSLYSGQKIYGTTLGYNERFVDDLKEYIIEGNYTSLYKRGLQQTDLIRKNDLIFEGVDTLSLLKNYL